MEKQFDDDEVEIDLLELLIEMKRKLWIILAVIVLFAGAAGAFSKLALTPQFTSTAMVYILSKETTLTSLADLQIGSQLTKDYKIIVTSRRVLNQVIEELNLDLTYKELLEKVSINNPPDTRILSISVTDPDPELAKQIADQIAKISSEYIGDIMEMVPPKLIEEGEVPVQKSSPSNTKNALLGGAVGAVLACGIIFLQVIMNDTIRTEEDVAKYLGLTVLASIPLRDGEKMEDKDDDHLRSTKTRRKKTDVSKAREKKKEKKGRRS
ncbi:MAG: YveK family protein [Lachnospiraceae bacterium]